MDYQYKEFSTTTWLNDTTTIFTTQKASNPPALPGTGGKPKPWENVPIGDGVAILLVFIVVLSLIKLLKYYVNRNKWQN